MTRTALGYLVLALLSAAAFARPVPEFPVVKQTVKSSVQSAYTVAERARTGQCRSHDALVTSEPPDSSRLPPYPMAREFYHKPFLHPQTQPEHNQAHSPCMSMDPPRPDSTTGGKGAFNVPVCPRPAGQLGELSPRPLHQTSQNVYGSLEGIAELRQSMTSFFDSSQ